MVGWRKIGPDPWIAGWAIAARKAAVLAVEGSSEGWRCGGTWFVGVDALPNDTDGRVGGVDFPWEATGLSRESLHPGQISVVRPGYPQEWAGETEAAFGYRLRRDAAHLDGILPEDGGARRVREPHGWILGVPLNDCEDGASPLVVWEGSHQVMRRALIAAFEGVPGESWGEVDISAAYQAARRLVFETCVRREIPVRVGEATLLHRLCLHGVAPWKDRAFAPEEGRMIAYFRPQMGSVQDWLLRA